MARPNRKRTRDLRLLDSGAGVAALQADLQQLGFDVSAARTGQFDRATLEAVRAFQRRAEIAVTGIADTDTQAALRAQATEAETLRTRARWRQSIDALRRTERLGVPARQAQLPVYDGPGDLAGQLSADLKDRLRDALGAPSQALSDAIEGLTLDPADLAELPMREVLFSRALPELLENTDLQDELSRLVSEELEDTSETVSEVMRLGGDVRDTGAAAELVARARNAALGDIAGLDTGAIDALADADLSENNQAILRSTDILNADQRGRLMMAADLSRLLDDNFTAVRALMEDGVRDTRALVRFSASDWGDFLARQNIALPAGETQDSYAAALDRNVEQAFPTAYAMTRYAAPATAEELDRLAVLDRLPSSAEPIFDESGLAETLNLSAMPQDEADAARDDLGALAAFANRHAGLGLRDVLNDAALSTAQKRQTIARRQEALASAWQAHSDLDLHLASFTALDDPTARAFTVDLDTVDPEDRPFVRSALQALQRTRRLTNGYTEADQLMRAGLDNALAIAALDTTDLLVARTGLETGAAARIRARATEVRARMLHFIHGLEDNTGHAPFQPQIMTEAAGPDGPGPLINVLQDLPGYAELFGAQNYCKCSHCQSILSPAAYFVDLMRFIEAKISRPNFTTQARSDHPAYLFNRRPDLWSLPLTCENTDGLVRYLTIVNEVLGRYLEDADPLDGPLWQTLATEARSSFLQPFNLPHKSVLLYLEHLGLGLDEIAALYAPNRAAPAYAVLGIAPQEAETITAADTGAVFNRYGLSFGADLTALDTASLTRATGLTREMLERVLATDYVRANLTFEARITAPDDDLIGLVETLHVTVPGGVDETEAMRACLDRMHRFVRLMRALSWAPEEIQIALDALTEGVAFDPLDAEMLGSLGQLSGVMDSLDVSVSEAIALVHAIPRAPAAPEGTSLWAALFGDSDTLEVWHPMLGNVPADAEADVSLDFGRLQGALRLSEPDLIDLLTADIPAADLATGTIDAPGLTRLYRTARTAQALDVSHQILARLRDVLPDLRAAASPRSRLVSLRDAQRLVATTPFDQLSVFLGDAAHRDHIAAAASDALTSMRSALAVDPQLWLTPASLAQIDGLGPQAARSLLERLADLPSPWVVRPDPEVERYLLTDAATLDPADTTLTEALSTPGAPLAGPAVTADAADFLLASVRRQLEIQRPSTRAADALAGALEMPQDMLTALSGFFADPAPLADAESGLSALLQDPEAPPSDRLLAYVGGLIWLRDLFRDTLEMDAGTLAFVQSTPALFGLAPLDLADLVPTGWDWPSLHGLARFAQLSDVPEARTHALQRGIAAWDGATFPASAHGDLALYLDVTTGQIAALMSELPPDADALTALERLANGAVLTARTGLDPTSLRQLVSTDFNQISAARDLVHGAMRLRHPDEARWHEINEAFEEKIDNFKRDALVDRILSRPELGFDTARDIYHFFLLDAQMDGCFRTSRVKNAISSCQIYVQRCLMGLERSVETADHPALTVTVKDPNGKTRTEWAWRKTYRVWEANRKVFLYPENYLMPDLRDDRSHIFRAAEADLLQGNLDNTGINRVFQRYLAGFSEIGDLQLVDTIKSAGAYHLIARTRQEPFRYFTRRFNGKHRWHPWEPIDLDIGAREVSAVTRRGQLYLFWTNIELAGDAEKARGAAPDIDTSQVADDAGEPDRGQESFPINVSFATRDENGIWSAPRDFLYYTILLSKGGQERNRYLPISDRIYAEFGHSSGSTGGSNSGVEGMIRLIHPVWKPMAPSDYGDDLSELRQYLGFLRESDLVTIRRDGVPTSPLGHKGGFAKWARYRTPGLHFGNGTLWRIASRNGQSMADIDYTVNGAFKNVLPGVGDSAATGDVLGFGGIDRRRVGLRAVQRATTNCILSAGDLQYLIRRTGKKGTDSADAPPGMSDAVHQLISLIEARWRLVPLSTGYPARLSQRLHKDGIDALLSLDQQRTPEPRSWEQGISYTWTGQIRPPHEDMINSLEARALAQFDGVHGHYLWEVHFHLPFLIGHTLNSLGQFEEAARWYGYIFDPTAAGEDTDAHWRFAVFRTLKLPKLRKILTQSAAIKAYKTDPFNPFAIARLRPSAFQKAIVMRYIDNLLDWGDQRFAEDTRESISEAHLLYTMAADLLGERPVQTGECATEEALTYFDVAIRGSVGEFLIELENLIYFYVYLDNITPVDPLNPGFEFTPFELPGSGPAQPGPVAPGAGFATELAATSRIAPHHEIRHHLTALTLAEAAPQPNAAPATGSTTLAGLEVSPPDPSPPFEPDPFDINATPGDDPDPDGDVLEDRRLGFCVPPNETLLGYWDRVEDRLFKLRHCMNIDGVVRQLPLFQPPIDPMLLVRAKAAGLSFDDILSLINAQPPQHRFEVLLDRARRFASQASQLSAQLLSALERRDEAELTELRAVHEDTILSLARQQKSDAIKEAEAQLATLGRNEAALDARIAHYTALIGTNEAATPPGTHEFGMIDEEANALAEMLRAKEKEDSASRLEGRAQRYREIGPQWNAGTSNWAGIQTPVVRSGADANAHWGSVNIEARFQRRAQKDRASAAGHSALAGMASTTAGHLRRLADWKLQRDQARREKTALLSSILAAEIRVSMAEKELAVHDQQVKHSREIYDFAKDRFTGLGLYTWLSTELSRLSREAYDMAFRMAQAAERAYRFELGEDSFFIKPDNWSARRAGLLAADRLTLQLQAMEAAHVDRDVQRHEITLACPLSLIDPDALLQLRLEGRAAFDIPEWWFDLHYPGQYRRILAGVRVTLPCVTGPYTNVGARLTLQHSAARMTADPAPEALVGLNIARNTSIATSSARSDSGVFEFRFDSPRNPPFKGAGAVSTWSLDLPGRMPVFDLTTISDAIIELSYTAEDDGLMRQQVEGEDGSPGTAEAQLASGMVRIVSLRHEMPDLFHLLTTPETGAGGEVALTLARNHILPHWQARSTIEITQLAIGLEPRPGEALSAGDLQGAASVTLAGAVLEAWAPLPGPSSIPAVTSNTPVILAEDAVALQMAITLPGGVTPRDILLRLSYRSKD